MAPIAISIKTAEAAPSGKNAKAGEGGDKTKTKTEAKTKAKTEAIEADADATADTKSDEPFVPRPPDDPGPDGGALSDEDAKLRDGD